MRPNVGRQVLRAARAAYEAEGTDGVSARKLADRVGVSPMAMYRHYQNKEELLRAVANEGFAELTTAIRRADPIELPLERIVMRAQHWLDFSLAHPRLFALMFEVPRSDARRYPEDFRAQRSPTGTLFEQDIAEAIADGAIPDGDPLEAGIALWAAMHGLIMLRFAGRIALSDDEFRRLYVRSIRRVLTGHYH
jgi:AcrR family transcriptional regulator